MIPFGVLRGPIRKIGLCLNVELNETCTVPRIIQASLYLHSLLRLAWTVSEVVVAGAGDDIGGGGAGTVDGDSVHGDKMKGRASFSSSINFYELV